MEDLTEDEQLRLAIQMSLEEADETSLHKQWISSPRQKNGHLDGEESEVSLNKSYVHTLTILKVSNSGSRADEPSPNSSISENPEVLIKATEHDQPGRPAKRLRTTPPVSPPPRQKQRTAGIQPDHEVARSGPLASSSGSSPQQSQNGPQYKRGVIKRTWASSHNRNNDIRIEEVLQKEYLRKAALSSFQWDDDWLWSKLDLAKTNVMVIMQGKTDDDQRLITEDARAFNSRLKLCFPPMPGQVNCMHSKLMLLFYDTYLRIAIPSANLTKYDWGDDGRMENSVFLIDLPQILDQPTRPLEELTQFGQDLHYFLQQMDVPDSLLAALLRYDFTETKQLAFVSTVGNDKQFGAEKDRTGYPGLSRAIRQLGLQSDNLQIDAAASSLGTLKDDFLNALYASAKGEKTGAAPTVDFKNRNKGYRNNMRICFPSHDTVINSLGGPDAAGTIWFQKRWFDDPSFPKGLLRDYKSTRAGLLSHNKILLGRGTKLIDSISKRKKAVAWAYIGSHNLSESAWGRVTIDKTRKETKINCKNWECGVVMPVLLDDDFDGMDVPPMEVFEKHFSLPFEYPGEGYDGKEPWFMES